MSTRDHAKKKHQKGFSVLEIIIAMSLMMLTLTAVVTVSFGNQGMLIGGETNSEAVNKAAALIETVQALARKDFDLVIPVATTTDGIYREWVSVTSSTTEPYLKTVTAHVSWMSEHRVPMETALTALVTNFQHAIGGSTCSSVLSGDWTRPQIVNVNTDLAALVGGNTGDFLITGIDAYRSKLYVTTDDMVKKETFFVFDVSDPSMPTLLAARDNDANMTGLNAVTVALHSGDQKVYAYVASASSFVRGQLQIFDVTDPRDPQLVTFANGRTTFKIATSTVSQLSSGQGVGNSMLYRNGVIYLGLTKTGSGPEFNIIDVHDPSSPVWIGGYAVGNTINAMAVRGNYVYIASPNSQELLVLDISNPALPVKVSGFSAPTGAGSGKSISVAGDRLYLGETVPNAGPEFYVFDDSSYRQPTMINAHEIDASVNGVVVRDALAFLLTNDYLNILNIADVHAITPWTSPLELSGSGTSGGSTLDCEGNMLYAGTNVNGKIYIITSTP